MKKLFTLLLTAFFTLTLLCGCGFINISDFSSYENASSYNTASGTVTVQDIKNIEIYWVSGTVKIEGSDGDSVSFSEISSLDEKSDSIGEATENKELSESLKMRYKTEDGKLIIQFCKSGLRVRSGAVKDLKKDLTVSVPKGVDIESIKADAVSSDITVSDVKSNDIKINSVSANVNVCAAEIDKIACKTVSGHVNITSSGKTDTTDVDTVSGNVTLNAASTGSVSIKSVSGNANLYLDSFDFKLRYSGINTALQTNGIEYDKTDDDTYVFGSGSGSVTFESVSGKITLSQNQ